VKWLHISVIGKTGSLTRTIHSNKFITLELLDDYEMFAQDVVGTGIRN